MHRIVHHPACTPCMPRHPPHTPGYTPYPAPYPPHTHTPGSCLLLDAPGDECAAHDQQQVGHNGPGRWGGEGVWREAGQREKGGLHTAVRHLYRIALHRTVPDGGASWLAINSAILCALQQQQQQQEQARAHSTSHVTPRHGTLASLTHVLCGPCGATPIPRTTTLPTHVRTVPYVQLRVCMPCHACSTVHLHIHFLQLYTYMLYMLYSSACGSLLGATHPSRLSWTTRR